MRISVYDDACIRAELLPLTYTRPVGALRVGIDTIAEKWQSFLPGEYFWSPAVDYLSERFPAAETEPDIHVAGHVIPDRNLADAVSSLSPGQKLLAGDRLIAYAGSAPEACAPVEYGGEVKAVEHLWDIFMLNGDAISADFERITSGRPSQPLSDTVTVVGDPALIFLEEGTTVEGAIISASRPT